MAKREDIKDLKRFIRERGLTRSFNKYQKIRSKPKRILESVYDNYDGTQRRSRVIAMRSSRGTNFLDYKTLRVIGRSRRKLKDAIKVFRSRREIRLDLKARDWSVKEKVIRNGLKINNEHKLASYNELLQRTTNIRITNTTPKNKFGFANIDATYIGLNGERVRVRARSSGGRRLWVASERKKAIENAIENGSAIAGFSPLEIIVHNWWFEYWTTTFGRLNRVR